MPDEFDFIIAQSKHPCGSCLYEYRTGASVGWYLEDDTCCNRDWSGGPACEPGTETIDDEDCLCPCADDYPDSGTENGCPSVVYPTSPEPNSHFIVDCGPGGEVGECRTDGIPPEGWKRCFEPCTEHAMTCHGQCLWEWECILEGGGPDLQPPDTLPDDRYTDVCPSEFGLPGCRWIWQPNVPPCANNLPSGTWVERPGLPSCAPTAGAPCGLWFYPCKCFGKPDDNDIPALVTPGQPCGGSNPVDEANGAHLRDGVCKKPVVIRNRWKTVGTVNPCVYTSGQAECNCYEMFPDVGPGPYSAGGVPTRYNTACYSSNCCKDGEAPWNCSICRQGLCDSISSSSTHPAPTTPPSDRVWGYVARLVLKRGGGTTGGGFLNDYVRFALTDHQIEAWGHLFGKDTGSGEWSEGTRTPGGVIKLYDGTCVQAGTVLKASEILGDTTYGRGLSVGARLRQEYSDESNYGQPSCLGCHDGHGLAQYNEYFPTSAGGLPVYKGTACDDPNTSYYFVIDKNYYKRGITCNDARCKHPGVYPWDPLGPDAGYVVDHIVPEPPKGERGYAPPWHVYSAKPGPNIGPGSDPQVPHSVARLSCCRNYIGPDVAGFEESDWARIGSWKTASNEVCVKDIVLVHDAPDGFTDPGSEYVGGSATAGGSIVVDDPATTVYILVRTGNGRGQGSWTQWPYSCDKGNYREDHERGGVPPFVVPIAESQAQQHATGVEEYEPHQRPQGHVGGHYEEPHDQWVRCETHIRQPPTAGPDRQL